MTTAESDTTGAGLYRFDQVAPLVDADAVGEAERRAYQELGFLAVRDLIGPADVHNGLAGLAAVAAHPEGVLVNYETWATDVAQRSGDELLDVIRKFQGFVGHEDRLDALSRHPAVLSIVRSLLGHQPALLQDMALLKPPGGGREKPWHQDKAFFRVHLDEPVVGVWIALDDATVDNGAMHIMPGSHRDGPALHFHRRDYQICDSSVASHRDTVVPLAAGSALFFDGLMHHGTPPNHSTARRRALQFHYARAQAVRVEEAERLAAFGGELRGATC